jgi:hypothetical protein
MDRPTCSLFFILFFENGILKLRKVQDIDNDIFYKHANFNSK